MFILTNRIDEQLMSACALILECEGRKGRSCSAICDIVAGWTKSSILS